MIDWTNYLPDMSIDRGGIRYPKFTLTANGLPVLIKDSYGIMLRLTAPHGFEGTFYGRRLDVHDEDNLLQVVVSGELSAHATAGYTLSVGLTHLEGRHDKTGHLASSRFVLTAPRRTPKGRRRLGAAPFQLELFRPQAV